MHNLSNSSSTQGQNNLHNDSKTYITSDETKPDITRMEHNRDMIVGIWSKGKFDHSSMFICYFSQKDDCYLICRLFSIELFSSKETKENVLSIKGPSYDASYRKYDCKKFYSVHSNMKMLVDIAKNTMDKHGRYNYIKNNCRHFCDKYLKNIKAECETFID